MWFGRSVMSDSLQPHGLQHPMLPYPSPSPGAYSNSGPLSWVMPSNHLILCHSLLLLPLIFPSIRVFSNESTLHIRWQKSWEFQHSPSNDYSGLISIRIGWFDLLAVKGTLESSPTPQFESTNSLVLSLLYESNSHPYMTTGKTIVLTILTFVCKMMPLFFNISSMFV